MHSFANHCERSTNILLRLLKDEENTVFKQMETSAATINILLLRDFNHTRAFYTIGMFSSFEAVLQSYSYKSFQAVKDTLEANNSMKLLKRFNIYKDAINVLKHGKGSSYDRLKKKVNLPFTIKYCDEPFYEGDVSEIDTLIDVDNEFIVNCVDLIRDVCIELGITTEATKHNSQQWITWFLCKVKRILNSIFKKLHKWIHVL